MPKAQARRNSLSKISKGGCVTLKVYIRLFVVYIYMLIAAVYLAAGLYGYRAIELYRHKLPPAVIFCSVRGGLALAICGKIAKEKARRLAATGTWCGRGDSNLWPLESESNALSS